MFILFYQQDQECLLNLTSPQLPAGYRLQLYRLYLKAKHTSSSSICAQHTEIVCYRQMDEELRMCDADGSRWLCNVAVWWRQDGEHTISPVRLKKMKQPFILKADYQPTDRSTGVYLRGLLLSPAGLHTDGIILIKQDQTVLSEKRSKSSMGEGGTVITTSLHYSSATQTPSKRRAFNITKAQSDLVTDPQINQLWMKIKGKDGDLLVHLYQRVKTLYLE